MFWVTIDSNINLHLTLIYIFSLDSVDGVKVVFLDQTFKLS